MTKKPETYFPSLLFKLGCFSALVFFIYSPAFHAPFYLDDFHHLAGNPLFASFNHLKQLWIYEPTRFLTHLSFLFNISLSKDILLSLHLTNIVIHIANSLLVSLLCSQLLSLTHADFDRTKIGFWAGILFSVHPVNSQAIIYISQRATLLATFFYLSTIILYLLFREKKKRPYQIFSLLTCFLAMSCKEISITLPIVLILLHFALIEKNLKQAIRSCFPYILLLFLIPLYYRYHEFVVSSNIKQPDYFITQIRVALTYIRLFFLPTSLRLEYDYPIYTSFLNSQILIAVSFFTTFFCLSILFVKKIPLLLSAGIFFLLSLAPDSSFVALNDVIFEHRFYLPSVLIFCVFSQSLFLLFKNKLLRMLVILVVVSCYCYLTFNRAKEWSNPITLFENDIRLSPKNDRSYVNLGHYFLTVGDLPNAKKWFQKTLIINPNNARAHNNLGMMAKDQRLFDEAFVHFQRAIEIEPTLPQPHFNIGLMHHESGDYQAAIAEFQQAHDKDTAYLYAYLGMAHSLLLLNEYERALQQLDQVLEKDSKNLLAHFLKGKIFMQQGNWDHAEKHLLMLLDSEFTDPQVVTMLIEIYEKTNSPEKANAYKKRYQQTPAI